MSRLSTVTDNSFYLLCSCLFSSALSFSLFLLSNNQKFSLFVLVAFLLILLLYVLRQSKINIKQDRNLISERISLAFCMIFTYFINFKWSSAPGISSNIFASFSSILAGMAAIFLVLLISHQGLFSLFLDFIGGISYEIYLPHGMFMYSFDFIIFRQNIALTFFPYFAFIVFISLILRNISDNLFRLQRKFIT